MIDHVASSSASIGRAVRPSVPRRQKLSPPAVVLLPTRERRRHRPARRPLGDDLFDKIEARLRHVHDAGRLARVFEPHEDVSGAHQPAREAGEGERVGHHRTDRGAGLVVWVLRGISRRDIKVKNKGGEAMDRIGPNVALFSELASWLFAGRCSGATRSHRQLLDGAVRRGREPGRQGDVLIDGPGEDDSYRARSPRVRRRVRVRRAVRRSQASKGARRLVVGHGRSRGRPAGAYR